MNAFAPNTEYSVSLSVAQWDLVVLTLGFAYERAHPNGLVHNDPVQRLAERFLRRRLNEVIAEIQSTVPDAGSNIEK
jgi:hypothetical protein